MRKNLNTNNTEWEVKNQPVNIVAIYNILDNSLLKILALVN
jgi:hypothetical protein